MGKYLTKKVDYEDIEIARYNSFGFKDPKGKYVRYNEHCDEIDRLKELNEKLTESIVKIVNDIFR